MPLALTDQARNSRPEAGIYFCVGLSAGLIVGVFAISAISFVISSAKILYALLAGGNAQVPTIANPRKRRFRELNIPGFFNRSSWPDSGTG